MEDMKRKLNILLWCVMIVLPVMAQHHTIIGEVEPVVHVGDRFELRYVINTTDISHFVLGQMPDALEVLTDPNQSTSISSVSVDGHIQTTSKLTLTYVLSANKAGDYTIPPASVKAGGETIQSESLTVQVIASNTPGSTHATATTGYEFFVSVIPSKRRVSLYEPFLITYKVCWNPDLTVINLDPIILDLQNVYMLPYNDNQEKVRKEENVNGHILTTVDWQQYVVYPVKAGKLEIPSVKLKGYVHENMPFDSFDPFAADYHEKTKQLTASALAIQVDELPDKPSDFSGGVGIFSISAWISKDEVIENTPVSLFVTVKGCGNFNMLKEPAVVFPRGFDTYDTKQAENYQLTAKGYNGSLDYEFMAIPQHRGSFTIPPVKLTYFDLDSHSYKTILTDSIHVDVLKGEGNKNSLFDYSGNAVGQEKDIHPIKTGEEKKTKGQFFFASSDYFLILASIILLIIALFILLRYHSQYQADVEKVKGRRANKVAVRKLRKAAKLMKENKLEDFYDETLRALWEYVSDKLAIPVSQLSRKNISQRLHERGIDEQITNRFVEAIDECEYVRFAPGNNQGNMNRVYEKSITAIEQIESVKDRGKSRIVRDEKPNH